MRGSWGVVVALSVVVACAGCHRAEQPAEPVAAVTAGPTEEVPTPAQLAFVNPALRLAADALPAPFHVEENQGSTLVLGGEGDGVRVVFDVRSDLGPSQLDSFAADLRGRMERMARGRCLGVDKGQGPLGPLIWLSGEYVPHDTTVAITCLATVHPSGEGLLRMWFTHPPGDETSRRQQLLDLLPRLKAG